MSVRLDTRWKDRQVDRRLLRRWRAWEMVLQAYADQFTGPEFTYKYISSLDALDELDESNRSSFSRGYVLGLDGLRSETDAELRARILAGNHTTPGLGNK